MNKDDFDIALNHYYDLIEECKNIVKIHPNLDIINQGELKDYIDYIVIRDGSFLIQTSNKWNDIVHHEIPLSAVWDETYMTNQFQIKHKKEQEIIESDLRREERKKQEDLRKLAELKAKYE